MVQFQKWRAETYVKACQQLLFSAVIDSVCKSGAHRYMWLSHGTDKVSHCLKHQLWAWGLQLGTRKGTSWESQWFWPLVCASCFYEDLLLYTDTAVLHTTSQPPDSTTPHQWSLGPASVLIPGLHIGNLAATSGLQLSCSRQNTLTAPGPCQQQDR